MFAALIFVHQFASGRLFIQYDRLLWFLVFVLAATSSLCLNFERSRLTSYGLVVLIYFLFTLRRPSTPDQYKSTLQGFQSLVLILSCLAILEFPAQFIVDPRKLMMFFGIFPDSVLPLNGVGGRGEVNTMGTLSAAGGLLKSNGIFLGEASEMSQIAALGILIEILEFRRPRYLIMLTLGFLLAYSGTGITILLVSLPLAFLANRKAQPPLMLVVLFAFGLLATGVINLSTFTSRIGEFQDTRSSGFIRFTSSFWIAADYFPTASPLQLLLGNGPGEGAPALERNLITRICLRLAQLDLLIWVHWRFFVYLLYGILLPKIAVSQALDCSPHLQLPVHRRCCGQHGSSDNHGRPLHLERAGASARSHR